MKTPNQGYILLEVMIAFVILFCGILAVMDSFRTAIRVDAQAESSYAAALLLESQVLETEKSQAPLIFADADPLLGALIWNQNIQDHRVTLNWERGTQRHALELPAIITN